MRLHVGVDGFLIREGFSTGVTGRAIILPVRAPDMAVVSSVRCKRFTTVLAFEGLLPRVQLDVPEQVAFLREGGPALVALERPLSWGDKRESGESGTRRGQRRTRRESCFPRAR